MKEGNQTGSELGRTFRACFSSLSGTTTGSKLFLKRVSSGEELGEIESSSSTMS